MENNTGIGSNLEDSARLSQFQQDNPELFADGPSDKDKQQSFLKGQYEIIKGMVQGPAQLMANIKETVQGKENDFTKYYTNQYEQTGVEIGAALTAGASGSAAGAAVGTAVMPVVGTIAGAAIGGLVGGAFGYGFTRPTDESNVAQTLRDAVGKNSEVAEFLWEGLDKYSHQPGDSNLMKRYKNFLVEVYTDVAGSAIGSVVGTVASKSVPKAAAIYNDVAEYFASKRKMNAVEKAVANVDSNITALEAAKGTADNAVSPTEKLSKAMQEDTKTRVETMKPELEKMGKAVDDGAILASHEIEYTQKKLNEPKIEGDVTDFSDDTIAKLPPEKINEYGEQVNKTFSETDSNLKQAYLANPGAKPNRARIVAAQNASKVSGKSSPAMDMQALMETATIKSADENEVNRIAQKFAAGERLTMEEAAISAVKVQDSVLDPVLVEKIAQGNATPTEIAHYWETMQTLSDGMIQAAEVSSAVAREAGQTLNIYSFLSKYADADPTLPVNNAARMGAMQNLIEKAGIKEQTTEDAKAVLDFIINPSKDKELPDVLAMLTPDKAKQVQEEGLKILTAQKNEQLQALDKVLIRSKGTTIKEAIIGYMSNNMLLSLSTPMRVIMASPFEVGMTVVDKYASVATDAIMSRSFSNTGAMLDRANHYASSIIHSFITSARVARDADRLLGFSVDAPVAMKNAAGAFKQYKAYGKNVYEPTSGQAGKFIEARNIKRAEAEAAKRNKQVASLGLPPVSPEDAKVKGSLFSYIKNGTMAMHDSVGRILVSADAAISHTVAEASLISEAAYMANRKGLQGAEFEEFVRNIPEDIIKKHWDEAQEAGNRAAARGEIDFKQINAIYKGLGLDSPDSTVARILSPFYLASANGIERVVEHSPIAVFMPQFREALEQGGKKKADLLAKMATGTTAVTAGIFLYRNNFITGPSKDHKVFDENGQQVPPFSVKSNGKWVPINSVTGNGTVTALIKAAGYLDSALDYMTVGKYYSMAGMLSASLFDNGRYSNLVDVFGSVTDMIDDMGRAGSEDAKAQIQSRWIADFSRRLLPGARLAGEIGNIFDEYEREKVVGDEDTIASLSNHIAQTFYEQYAPGKLAYKPNYFGEPIKRKGTFFYTTDQYSVQNDEDIKAKLPLKVLKDLADHTAINGGEETGLDKLEPKRFPEFLKDSGEGSLKTGYKIPLTPNLFNKYAAYVSGYDLDGNQIAKPFRQEIEEILHANGETLNSFYNQETVDKTSFNSLIYQIKEATNTAHERARNLIRTDDEYIDLVKKKIHNQEKLEQTKFRGE